VLPEKEPGPEVFLCPQVKTTTPKKYVVRPSSVRGFPMCQAQASAQQLELDSTHGVPCLLLLLQGIVEGRGTANVQVIMQVCVSAA
jgi:hypothetical protein